MLELIGSAIIIGLAVYYTWDNVSEWLRIIYVRWTR